MSGAERETETEIETETVNVKSIFLIKLRKQFGGFCFLFYTVTGLQIRIIGFWSLL